MKNATIATILDLGALIGASLTVIAAIVAEEPVLAAALLPTHLSSYAAALYRGRWVRRSSAQRGSDR